MTIIHLPYTYFPSPCGGTEVYVAALCRELAPLGVTSMVAAPSSTNHRSTHEGVEVHRFAIDLVSSLAELNRLGDRVAAGSFARLLDELKPDIVHFHAQSPAVGLPLLDEVRRRGISTVYTYHTATVSCHRGTLMRWGKDVCDGELRALRCAACQMQGLGLPRTISWLAAWTSVFTRQLAPWFPGRARWHIPLQGVMLARERHATVRAWFAGMDRIVVLNAWTEGLLKINGVTMSRVRKVRHGVTQVPDLVSAVEPKAERLESRSKTPLRLLCLGRLDPMKGFHLILDALARSPALAVTIDFYTLREAESGRYAKRMQRRLEQDSRVRVRQAIAADEVIAMMRNYDALLVPSQGVETGPLVVLEAFAAGIPIVGSGFGGVAEWVTHERDGLLVRQGDTEGWASAMQRLVNEPDLLPRMRASIRMPRLMSEVAADMMTVYREVTALQR